MRGNGVLELLLYAPSERTVRLFLFVLIVGILALSIFVVVSPLRVKRAVEAGLRRYVLSFAARGPCIVVVNAADGQAVVMLVMMVVVPAALARGCRMSRSSLIREELVYKTFGSIVALLSAEVRRGGLGSNEGALAPVGV